MNKILVEVSVGELLDKLTILEIKKDKIKDAEKLKFINFEYDSLKEQYDKNVKVDEKIKNLFSELKEINAKLWDIEDNKRQCEKDSKFDDHFILLSREIHFLNDKRASIKLEINNHTGSKIKDSEKLKFINLEYDSLKEQYDKNVKVDDKIKNLFSELKEINAKLWDIEDNKRKCEKDSKFDDHFILLSREVHFLNDKRANIKLEVNNHTGSKIKEIKEYTKY